MTSYREQRPADKHASASSQQKLNRGCCARGMPPHWHSAASTCCLAVTSRGPGEEWSKDQKGRAKRCPRIRVVMP
eukprot:6185002-Pleurochrysis_carterae.AAC.4